VEWEAKQVQRGYHDRQDSGPGLELEQANAADEARQRKHEHDQEDQTADAAQEGNPENIRIRQMDV
jgi:hypothetical protein